MTARQPPVWLLDVDGVINASKAGWGGPPRSRWVRADGVEYRVRWSPDLIDRMRLLHAAGAVEILWATSWVGHTHLIESAVGLPSLPTAFPTQPSIPDVTAAKRQAALDLVSAGRRLIWTDDEAFSGPWPPRDILTEAGHLLIAPRPSRGLRSDDMDRIEHYAAA